MKKIMKAAALSTAVILMTAGAPGASALETESSVIADLVNSPRSTEATPLGMSYMEKYKDIIVEMPPADTNLQLKQDKIQ